ncbi:methyltransferase domain-containing protein [Streptomyces nojiriensis]|uniref:methyltransferase domain-containing protein n=1 Tax=Streptomyces nojiriensis TaxID=66374 RepID=UPI001E495EDE|nr:methyltransferase domain-containing protein [Streptomyces nojiriensis]
MFAPTHTDSTELFTRWLPFPAEGSFLEMGCGAGVTAVTAALEGCARVTAADINPEAVRNTHLNATRHGVADRVEAVRSDLFDALDPGARFDVVFWNSNVVHAPADFAYTRDLEYAVFDRDYAAHRRYIRDGLARLSGAGRLFLGFNSLGDTARLDAAVAEAGARITEHTALTRRAGDVPVAFRLMEITR